MTGDGVITGRGEGFIARMRACYGQPAAEQLRALGDRRDLLDQAATVVDELGAQFERTLHALDAHERDDRASP